METPLRICTVQIRELLTLRKDIPVGKVTNIKPYFEGIAGSTLNIVGNFFWSEPINYTISIASSFGTDGCQGMIARNESDVLIGIVDYPVNEEYEKVNPILTFTEEPLVILQVYNRTHQKQQLADIVEQSMNSFSMSLWMSIVCFVLFMGMFLKMRERVLHDPGPKLDYFEMRRDWWLGRRKPWEQDTSYPFFESFSFFIQHDSNDFSDATRRIITLIISVSSFIIITGYFCNFMTTDMVVVDKPDVMNSYDDVLDRSGVTAVFVKQMTSYEHFRDADKDSKEYKLWKVMTTERSTDNEILMDPQGLDGIMPYYFKAMYGLNVGIISGFLESAIRAGTCRLKLLVGGLPDLMTYSAVDSDSPRYGKGYIFRQTNIPYLKPAAKRLRRGFETGFAIIGKKRLHEAGLTFDLGDTKIDWDNFRDCMSPTPVMDKPRYKAAHLGNYRSLAIFLVVSLSISFAILFWENMYFFWKYGGRRMPRRQARIITV